MTPLQMVRQFHEAFGVPAYDTPRIPPPVRQTLRRSLIEEEWWETYHALMGASVGTNDIAEIADGLADLVVVIYGTDVMSRQGLDAPHALMALEDLRSVGLAVKEGQTYLLANRVFGPSR